MKEKKDITDMQTNILKSNYNCSEKKQLVKNKKSIDQNIFEQTFRVIDARGRDRFEGKVPEPRKGLRGGNIKIHFVFRLKNV